MSLMKQLLSKKFCRLKDKIMAKFCSIRRFSYRYWTHFWEQLVNATPRYLNFSTCFSVAPSTCNSHWSGFLERWSTSVLAALIFISAVSHASAKLFKTRWRPHSVKESSNQIISEKQTTDFAISSRGTLISLSAIVDPIHVNNEKERWQNAPLSDSKAHMKRLWLLAIYQNANPRLAVE